MSFDEGKGKVNKSYRADHAEPLLVLQDAFAQLLVSVIEEVHRANLVDPFLGRVMRRMNDYDYKPPFPLTAKLNKLTIKVDRPELSAADIRKLQAAMIEKAKSD